MLTYNPREDLVKTVKLLCPDIFMEITDEDIRDIISKLNLSESLLLLRKPLTLTRAVNKFILRRKTNFYGRVFHTILKLRRQIRQMLNVTSRGEIKFLLRVDDFPRADIPSDNFYRFYEILQQHTVPFLLGVTPFISKEPTNPHGQEYRRLTEKELHFLENTRNGIIEIALHGFSHQVIDSQNKSELVGLSTEELKKKILSAMDELSRFNIRFFIPAFNTLDINNFRILAEHFTGICSGREALPYLNFRITPSYFFNILYIPSYEPVYGYSFEISNYVDQLLLHTENIVVPLTLHWSWEVDNEFRNVELLAKKIKDKTIAWNQFIKGQWYL